MLNKHLFGKKEFKVWASSLYTIRQYRNMDIYKKVEESFVEKFLQIYDQLEIIDIVPICRNLVRGLEFDNLVLYAKFEEFLITNKKKYLESITS